MILTYQIYNIQHDLRSLFLFCWDSAGFYCHMLYACTRGRSKKLHSAAVMLIAAASGGNFTGLCCVLFPQHTLSPNSAVCEQIACCIALLMFVSLMHVYNLKSEKAHHFLLIIDQSMLPMHKNLRFCWFMYFFFLVFWKMMKSLDTFLIPVDSELLPAQQSPP